MKLKMAESALAKYLAGNEKKTRDRGFKRLKKYLLARTNSPENEFEREDLMKLWKGLHYCMWMCDKPLVQEELADQFARLTGSIESEEQALLFLDTYVATECREWFGIDKWRVDKFLMLFRRMLRSGLRYIADRQWKQSVVTGFIKIFDSAVLNARDKSPDGIKLHVIGILLEELARVGGLELSEQQTMQFLEPFCRLVASSENTVLVKYVFDHVFDEIGYQAFPDPEEDEQESGEDEQTDGSAAEGGAPGLKFDYALIADRLFQLASSEDCLQRNRKLLYAQVTKLRQVARGLDPYQADDVDEELETDPISEKRLKRAAKSLQKFKEKLRADNQPARKRKKEALQSAENESSVKKRKLSDKEKSSPCSAPDETVAVNTAENSKETQGAAGSSSVKTKAKQQGSKKLADDLPQVNGTPQNESLAQKNRKTKKRQGADEERRNEAPRSESVEPKKRKAAKADQLQDSKRRKGGAVSNGAPASGAEHKRVENSTKADLSLDESSKGKKTAGKAASKDEAAPVENSANGKNAEVKKRSRRRKEKPLTPSGPVSALSLFKKGKHSEPEEPAKPVEVSTSTKTVTHQGFVVSKLQPEQQRTTVGATEHNAMMHVQKMDPRPETMAQRAGIRFDSIDEAATPVFFKKAVSKVAKMSSGKKKAATPQSVAPAPVGKTPLSENRRVSFGLHRNLVQEFHKQEKMRASPVPSPLSRPRHGILKPSPAPHKSASAFGSPQLKRSPKKMKRSRMSLM